MIYSALAILVLAAVGALAVMRNGEPATSDSSGEEVRPAGQVTIPTIAMNQIPPVAAIPPVQDPAAAAFADHLAACHYYGQTMLPMEPSVSSSDYFPTPSSGPR